MATAHAEPNYMAIFWWLFALTIAEVAVIYMGLPKLALGILLVGLALSKAALVAMYFMHLRFERRTLALIVMTPLFLCVLLVFALLPDHSAVPHQSAASSRPPAAAQQ
ncbi:MAG: cytochrome C oxidase subunit IV family protein [candidate division NC10 bacterium]|nr:cytochrome C oxidase subunit IV family protein [candidate division NC10 bacterium]